MRVLLVALSVASAASASSISDEIALSSQQSTDASPRTGSVTNSLNGSFDLNEAWSLTLGANITRSDAPVLPARSLFKNVVNDPFELFTAGVDWEASDHWTLGLSGEFSPKSTQSALPSIPNVIDPTQPLRRATAYLQVDSLNSEWGARLDVGYDSAGESDLEWSFNAGFAFSATSIDQTIPDVEFVPNLSTLPVTSYTAAKLKADCQSGTITCPPRVVSAVAAAGKQQAQPLDSDKLSLAVTATTWVNTDWTLAADYYVYNQDPASIGVPSIALREYIGSGLAMAPLEYMLRAEWLHRWGGFSARLSLQAGRYVPGTGDSTGGAALKLQYKFSRAFRMWANLNVLRDVDQDGVASRSTSAALGASYRF